MEAEPHPLQRARIEALLSYEILDTDRERDFDEIVKLAAAICGTAISVINLIDAERQWFKAETGLGVRETPLATSICAHVILEDDFVEIEDTLLDPRMKDNPLCCGEPGLRFYAGALLRTAEGLPLGTLCVLDHAPRRLSPLQRDAVRVLARQVMAQLEMRKALRMAAVMRQEVDHRVKNSLQSLAAFARIQRRAVSSPEAEAALGTMMARIEAVSQLHAQLYRQEAGAEVDLGVFVETLCGRLSGLAPPGVQLRATTAPVKVGARQAVAVGTLLNEFVANSYKHGFPDGRSGEVRVSLLPEADGKVRLEFSDTGAGLPADMSPETQGLGMKVAEVVCMELGCTLDLRNGESGVRASLRFAAGV